MPRRVTVILSQGRRLGVEHQHREDELIAALLMHPSAEATIITDLAQMDPESTDRLCLESIAGTAVLFAWHAPQVASDAFEKLGIPARLVEGSDASDSTDDSLAIHYFDLNESASHESYADRIRQIAEEAAVAPVALTDLVNGGRIPLVDSAPNPGSSSTATQQISTVRESSRIDEDGSDDRDALDDLMDEFDAVDL